MAPHMDRHQDGTGKTSVSPEGLSECAVVRGIEVSLWSLVMHKKKVNTIIMNRGLFQTFSCRAKLRQEKETLTCPRAALDASLVDDICHSGTSRRSEREPFKYSRKKKKYQEKETKRCCKIAVLIVFAHML